MENRMIQAQQEVNLDKIFTRLIAKELNVEESKVTVEFIRQQREKTIYPNIRYNVGSAYGGYDHEGLLFLTRNEFKEIGKMVDEFMLEIYNSPN